MEESRGRLRKRDDKNQVMDVTREDHCLIVRAVGYMLGIGKSSVQRVMSDLSMTRICEQWVPHQLNKDQMQSRASASNLKNPTKRCIIF